MIKMEFCNLNSVLLSIWYLKTTTLPKLLIKDNENLRTYVHYIFRIKFVFKNLNQTDSDSSAKN